MKTHNKFYNILYILSLVLIFSRPVVAQTEKLFEPAIDIQTLRADVRTRLKTRIEKIRKNLPQVIRSKVVRFRLNLADRIGSSNKLDLNIFPDTKISLIPKKIKKRIENYTWTGEDPESQSYATLVVQGDDTVGTIRSGGKLYQIRPVGDGMHNVAEINESAFKDHPPSFKGVEKKHHPLEDEQIRDALANDEGNTIKIMVAYTKQAETEAGNINALIQLAIDETNQAYINSEVPSQVELVHKYKTNYTDSGSVDTDKDRFIDNNDGHMDEIHSLRNTHKADVAMLLTGTSDYCGVAADIAANAENAFAVTAQDCATGYYSFGHELGHLIGLRHNPEADPSTTPFKYGHGYRKDSGGWRTVMSYNSSDGCCTRKPYFSNPDVDLDGDATGTKTSHNNSRVLSERTQVVANFRQSGSSGSIPIPITRLLKLRSPYMRGDDVRQVQEALISQGFSLVADGIFGRGTKRAVKRFQRREGLWADGIVGSKTRQALGLM